MLYPQHRERPYSDTIRGVVTAFYPRKGFGFIKSDGLVIYFHQTNFFRHPDHKQTDFRREPVIGDQIIFRIHQGHPNPSAVPWCFAEIETPKPRLVEKVVSLITQDERTFFTSSLTAQRTRFEVELDWVRRTKAILRAECTCDIVLHSLERSGDWKKMLLAVLHMPHLGRCALHLFDAPTHVVTFRLQGRHPHLQHELIELVSVQMSDESPP